MSIITNTTLKRAREILDKPEAWTKWVFIKERNGNHQGVTLRKPDPETQCFCISGAAAVAVIQGLSDFEINNEFDDVYDIADAVNHELADLAAPILGSNYGVIARWNNAPTTTHEDVIDLLDKLIERTA